MSDLTDLILIYASLSTGVFAAVEAFRNWGVLKKIPNRALAVLVGVIVSVALTVAGLIDLPGIEGWREGVASGVLGLLAFAGAHGLHEASKRG